MILFNDYAEGVEKPIVDHGPGVVLIFPRSGRTGGDDDGPILGGIHAHGLEELGTTVRVGGSRDSFGRVSGNQVNARHRSGSDFLRSEGRDLAWTPEVFRSFIGIASEGTAFHIRSFAHRDGSFAVGIEFKLGGVVVFADLVEESWVAVLFVRVFESKKAGVGVFELFVEFDIAMKVGTNGIAVVVER